MSSPSIRIRMYRQKFGDCFLLRFPRQDSTVSSFNILIDCGLVTGGASPDKLRQCVDDIYQTTNGHLDLVVGTHEHWDHLSGFNQAREKFDQFTINKIWLAWTEDISNPLAQNLAKDRAAKITALRAAITQMNSAEFTDQKNRIQQVLSFFGDEPEEEMGINAGTPKSPSTDQSVHHALDYLRTRPNSSVQYCNPNHAPLTLDGVDGVRVYVFGPPAPKFEGDKQYINYIKMSDPNKIAKTYEADQPVRGAEASFAMAVSIPEDGSNFSSIQELSFPFDKPYRISVENARHIDFFSHNYFNSGMGDDTEWRCIDEDWLNSTSELALSLDSDTNNTSLVLAFELGEPGSGKVLLFAADAQVGNWLSWKDLSWTVERPGNPNQKITAHDLMARAVFYKVGHHGSHNATLSEQGLELMVSDEMAAMISVDKYTAENVKKWGKMPFDPLLDHLGRKTKGRIMRIDSGLPAEKPSLLTTSEWQSFLQSVTMTDDYIEYSI